jgi:hypothetical protein
MKKLNAHKIESKYSSVNSKYSNSSKRVAPVVVGSTKDNGNREEENDKLNSLIEEYRRENERCAQKIQDL